MSDFENLKEEINMYLESNVIYLRYATSIQLLRKVE